MSSHYSVEPIISDPSRPPVFFVTWESTLKCNLDCSYCGKEGHDNSLPHPTLDECKVTVDFLMRYLDLYMSKRKPDQRQVSMNIFGGESLIHPNIVEILDYCDQKYQPYKDRWSLGLNTVTNAVIKEKIWNKIVDRFDYWTISYHTESTHEQQELVRRNILDLKSKNKKFHVSVLMHTKYWDNAVNMIDWCKQHDIRCLPRQLDHSWRQFQFYYSSSQAQWLKDYYSQTSPNTSCSTGCSSNTVKKTTTTQKIQFFKKSLVNLVNMSDQGRQCCGGTPLHVDQDYSNTQTYVDNTFTGWSCSINYFFVFIKQATKEIFVNKDCQMNFEGKVGPIGTLDNYEELLTSLEKDLTNNTLPVITCAKKRCWCGICAPKASTKENFDKIMEKFLDV
jgi:sulfatase maturation enzyme AslB (radical SAM superfamily)